jgi:DNA replication and repair protein RecF
MSLVSLDIQNIRVYERIHLEPNPYLNLVSGANASGKTTLLEAISLLGTGRSFRTAQAEQLRRSGTTDLSVSGKLSTIGGETIRLGLTHGVEGRRVSINGLEQQQVSNLALHLPLQVISPDTHYEFQQSAKHRRGVLDWGLFHVEPDFHSLWARFQRILQQRNAALKDNIQPQARHVWDEELVKTGEILHEARARQTGRLLPHFQSCCQQLLGGGCQVDLVLDPGWSGEFSEALQRDRERDRARGFTHSGPQRADLEILLNGQMSKLTASHGQHKVLVLALRLAQISYLRESTGRACCLLLDDLAAELDADHRARLSRFLATLSIQVFVTTTELSLIDRNHWPSYKTFHVEHGMVVSEASI